MASTTCGGSLLTRRCLSSPRMRPPGSTTAARTVVAPTSIPTITSSRGFTGARVSGGELAPHLLDHAFDEFLQLAQARLGLRLPAQDEERLRVRGADEPPASGNDHPHPVHLDGAAVLAQLLSSALDGGELLVVGKVLADLGRAEGARHVREKLREGNALARDQLEKPGGGIDAVVEAVVAMAEEEMPAHLAGEERALLFHLGLDERMARLPHDGAAAAALDVVVEGLRALHLADDGGAGMVLEHVAGEEEQDLIAPQDPPLLVDRAEAIGVPVESD